MAKDITESDEFKNMGIDVGAVAGAKVADNNQLIPDGGVPDSPPQTVQPVFEQKQVEEMTQEQEPGLAIDVGNLKQEIYDKTTAQLVDLAQQFSKYAKETNAKIAALESTIAGLKASASVESPQQKLEQTPEQSSTVTEIKETKPTNKEDEYSSSDVSVDKIFDFSNTKGQSTPKPNR